MYTAGVPFPQPGSKLGGWEGAQTANSSGTIEHSLPNPPIGPGFNEYFNWIFWDDNIRDWNTATYSTNPPAGTVGYALGQLLLNGQSPTFEVLRCLDPVNEPEWHAYQDIPNTGILLAPNCWVFETLVIPGPSTNDWYGKPDCGKWGRWTEIYGDPDSEEFPATYGELKFLNFKNSRHKLDRY